MNQEGWDSVVFFDLGDTLASARVNPAGDRLVGLDIYPYARTVLEDLSTEGLRLGIISNTGQETGRDMQRLLEDGGIYEFFDPALLLYSSEVGLTKNSRAIFDEAARRGRAAHDRTRCLYVGEDALERRFAREAGMRAVPHPLLVREVLVGHAAIKWLHVCGARAGEAADDVLPDHQLNAA
jgi:leucyl aminopeptidase